MVVAPSIAEFLESDEEADEELAVPYEDASFFETPLFTMPISLTSTAEPCFCYF